MVAGAACAGCAPTPNCRLASAIEKTIAARDAGALRTPLKSHGYLFEVVIAESARASAQTAVVLQGGDAASIAKPLSNTAQAIARLEQRKRGG